MAHGKANTSIINSSQPLCHSSVISLANTVDRLQCGKSFHNYILFHNYRVIFFGGGLNGSFSEAKLPPFSIGCRYISCGCLPPWLVCVCTHTPTGAALLPSEVWLKKWESEINIQDPFEHCYPHSYDGYFRLKSSRHQTSNHTINPRLRRFELCQRSVGPKWMGNVQV